MCRLLNAIMRVQQSSPDLEASDSEQYNPLDYDSIASPSPYQMSHDVSTSVRSNGVGVQFAEQDNNSECVYIKW